MTYTEIQSALEAGEKVTRKVWEPGTTLTLNEGVLVKKNPQGEPEEGYSPHPYDVFETDWEVLGSASTPEEFESTTIDENSQAGNEEE